MIAALAHLPNRTTGRTGSVFLGTMATGYKRPIKIDRHREHCLSTRYYQGDHDTIGTPNSRARLVLFQMRAVSQDSPTKYDDSNLSQG